MTSWSVFRPCGTALLASVLMAACGGGSGPSPAAPGGSGAADGAASAQVPVAPPAEPGACASGADVPPTLTRRDCAP